MLNTLSATWLLCLLNDSEVTRWTPKIFGHCTRDSCESSMSIFVWVLARCVSGVKNVTDDFGAEKMSMTRKIGQRMLQRGSPTISKNGTIIIIANENTRLMTVFTS